MTATWFVPLERLRRRRARAEEVAVIRRGLRVEDERGAPEREAAERMLQLKLQLAAATSDVSSCGTCARGRPGERGRYAGGDCCSGRTELVFSDDEIAALAQTGTRARDLVLPPGEQAGCAFRGPTSCSLAVAHRPAICVRYACNTLQRELHQRDRLDEVERLAGELRVAITAFSTARAERREREWAEALVRSLER